LKILVSRPDKIGDVVLALHALKQLHRLRPDYSLSLDVSSYTRELAEQISFLDKVVSFEKPLEPGQFDVAVDLVAKLPTAQRHFKAKVPIRIGNSGRWFSALYNRRRAVRRSRALLNEAEYNWQFVSMVQEPLRHSNLVYALEPTDFKRVEPRVGMAANSVVLMPGKSISAESWPVENWLSLAELMVRGGLSPVFLLGPAEEEGSERVKEFVKQNDAVSMFSGLSLTDTLGLLSVVKGYIGTSTGITHLASVFGLPGLALYPDRRSMLPSRWAPFNSSLSVMQAGTSASAEAVMQQYMKGEISISTRAKISAFVICKNEEASIGRCLSSIAWCDEILIIDSGSTDGTLRICREFANVRIIEREWPGHRLQKEFGLGECRFEWILNLDSDEELSAEAKNHIVQVLESGSEFDGYFIRRLVYFFGRWWDKGGWHPEYRMRFFRKKSASWGGMDPHEKALVSGKTDKLGGFIYHYSFKDVADYIGTQNSFSTRTAELMSADGQRCNILDLLIRPLARFLKFYLFKLGFREGLAGFQVALLEAGSTFLKYSKLWELQNKRRNS